MTLEERVLEHRKRHKELHKAFDELLADFMWATDGPVLSRPIEDLMKWSFQQTQTQEEA